MRVTSSTSMLRWLVVALAGSSVTAGGLLAAGTPQTGIPGVAPVCVGPGEGPGHEYHYVVTGRVRVLAFWLGRHDVGEARVTESTAPEGMRRLTLLVGTDPTYAPMQINRWGYLAETTCAAGADLIGVMTEADEEALEDARSRVDENLDDRTVFKTIRSRDQAGQTQWLVGGLPVERPFTYHELALVLSQMPAAGNDARMALVEPGTDSGFLVAVSEALREMTLGAADEGRPAPPGARVYRYAGRSYQLQTTKLTTKPSVTIRGTVYPNVFDAKFEIRNLATRKTTTFSMLVGRDGESRSVPLRVVFRPRWWLELELLLEPDVLPTDS